jgi:hypothetical protein
MPQQDAPQFKEELQPNSVVGGFGRRLWDTAKAIPKLVQPQTKAESYLSLLGPGVVPVKHLAESYMHSAGNGLRNAFGDIKDSENQIMPISKKLGYLGLLRGGVEAGAALNPFSSGSAENVENLQNSLRGKEAVGQGLSDAVTLGVNHDFGGRIDGYDPLQPPDDYLPNLKIENEPHLGQEDTDWKPRSDSERNYPVQGIEDILGRTNKIYNSYLNPMNHKEFGEAGLTPNIVVPKKGLPMDKVWQSEIDSQNSLKNSTRNNPESPLDQSWTQEQFNHQDLMKQIEDAAKKQDGGK